MKKLIIAMMIIALVVVMAVSVSAEDLVEGDYKYVVNEDGTTVTITAFTSTTAENITIPSTLGGKTVTVIGEGAFSTSAAKSGVYKSIVIPNTVTTIAKQGFYNCRGVLEIVIPDSVTSVGDQAFWKLFAAKKLTIGSGLTEVGEMAFGGWRVLEEINVAAANTTLKVENGVLVNKTTKVALAGIEQETVKIPAGVEKIDGWAFYGPGTCQGKIKTVIIPDGVTYVGEYAFDATAISTLVVPKSVVEFGSAIAPNTPLHPTKASEANLEQGKIYYEGTATEWAAITKGSSANAVLTGSGIIVADSCINNPNGWTHSEGATCTYCNPPAPPAGDNNQNQDQNQGGTQTPTTPNAPQTGSSVTVLAVVAVVALAATSVVIKRRIED